MPEQAVEGAAGVVSPPPMTEWRRCSKCAVLRLPSNFHKRKDGAKRGWCKPCHAVYTNEWRKKNRAKARAWRLRWRRKNRQADMAYMKAFPQTQRGRFLQYQYGAKKRRMKFDLTPEQFATLWQKDCYYCGAAIPTIGIDRVDNTRGYSLENIVPCCSRCNGAKSKMTHDQFVVMCLNVARHMEKQNARG